MAIDTYVNPCVRERLPDAGFGPEDRAPLTFHATLPGYAPSPLRDCPGIADLLGVARVLVKDEGVRLGLPSFKILGASWASVTAIRSTWLPDLPPDVPTLRRALAGSGRTLVTATDGNHGRGVARMAALLGLSSHILVPAGTAPARISGIEQEGATVEVVDGSYEDAVDAAAHLAGDGVLVVSDTSWPGYEQTPRAVVEGYSTIFHEVDDQVRESGVQPPTFVSLQAGVGSFAAAGLRHYRGGRDRVRRTLVVEPDTAACLMASARAGVPTLVPGPHRSAMAGLNCGLPSPLVWPLVLAGTDVFAAIADEQAFEAMRLLAGVDVVAGESGAAGLAALLAAASDRDARAASGLSHEDCVLVVNTEGATDPENYARVTGNHFPAATTP